MNNENVDINTDTSTILEVLNHKVDLPTGLSQDDVEFLLSNPLQITNCITKLPQNINLEINNGVAILKAGSTVYVPNGVGVFEKIVLDSDATYDWSDGTTDALLFYDKNTKALMGETTCLSGDDTYTPTKAYITYYDITNNIIKRTIDGVSWLPDRFSLPIAIGKWVINEGIVSINQIFNNIGYIGTQIFILPGIEGLISNGRTENGNLKNISFSINNVITYPLYTGDQSLRSLILYYNTTTNNFDLGIFDVINDILTERIHIQETEPEIVSGGYRLWYQPSSNKCKVVKSDGIWKDALPFIIDYSTKEDDLSNTFLPNNAIQITDYNMYNKLDCLSNIGKNEVSTLSAPSKRYINLELQASETVYTMPANGYLCLAKAKSTNDDGNEAFVGLRNQTTGLATNGFTSMPSNFIRVNLPVKKNDKIFVYYTATGTLDYFRFIYAEGAQ